MKITGKKILLISPERWGKNHVSKHHFAAYLAKENQVFFLDPPNGFKKNPLGKIDLKKVEINDSLTSVHYKNLIPRLNSLPKAIQKKIYRNQANQIHQSLEIAEFDIVWSFDPYRFWELKCFKAQKFIYHTVDVHFRKCFEEELAINADLVLLSSELLRPNLKSYNNNIHYIGHGADLDTFQAQEKDPNQLESTFKLVAGLVGNFNNNVDYDLIEDIVKLNADVEFYFIGPYEDNNLSNDTKTVGEKVDHLLTYPNVNFIGSIPSSEIMKWLLSFDINMVLYREDKRDIIINPHKMMGYFYSGNITVCSWFKEYENAERELVYMTTENQEIPVVIKKIAQEIDFWNSPELKTKRKEYSVQNSYDIKIQKIGELLND